MLNPNFSTNHRDFEKKSHFVVLFEMFIIGTLILVKYYGNLYF